ncbi:hypothetical protein [Brucella pituitosa]|uniref:Uncharacterized protein n=1 Tax=Brucella pituitosa TaxID=571256 RepID=A0A643F4L9_9HYPH|nr:hypothetical protein [Brucella pituitosa]KAB0573166.1 hypothetical protein F7Q93_01305 [Brucella pituitosa]PRA56568.1 hypothetical protein CQ062_07855 [Ochrobactrum sp. MYb68]TCQ82889.1 hypothetical protein EDF68_1011289 [Ochrobactrum sp. BH3]
MIMKRFLMFTAVFSMALSASAFANDPSPTGLPGVEPQKPIVSAPPPAPEPNSQPAGTWKNFRVGNTDVSISGSITVDVGTGGSRSSGR